MDIAAERKVLFLNHNLQETTNGNDTASKGISHYASNSLPIAYIDIDIEKMVLAIRDMKIEMAVNEITTLILKDDFIDGEISESEKYMEVAYKSDNFDCIKEALMKVYTNNFSNSHIVVGILMMISRVPYDAIEPKGTLMALGSLSHKNLEVRDRVIQCFERWNSKKGLVILKSIECSPAWLQNYANKVISFIEEEGIE